MFNFCTDKIQLALYFSTVGTMVLGVLYCCLGSFVLVEFLPLLPSFWADPVWGLMFVYLIATGIFTILVGFIGLCGVDKYQPGTICLHRVLILLLIGLHGLGMFVFIEDAAYNKNRFDRYLSRSITQVLESDTVESAKTNEKIWNYFEAALNCKRVHNNCKPADAVTYIMVHYYVFVGFLGAAGLICLLDLILSFLF